MHTEFEAHVTAALFDRNGAAFALGDGTVRFESGERVEAHDGPVLLACAHPSGLGVISGGDDGRLVWSRPEGAKVLAQVKGAWLDSVAASAASGLIAFSAGRAMHVLDAADPAFSRIFTHERSVAGLAFDPKGRRIAAATYGGAALWYARIEDQKPQVLKWAGSHTLVAFAPDGRFLMSAMQENQLHGWRLSDGKDLRMGGYPAKVKSLVFLARGQILATSGSQGAVLWPFTGPNGPMGKEAVEVGYDQSATVVRAAAAPDGFLLAGGLDDGRVWACDIRARERSFVKAEKGPPISALSMSGDGKRVAWGDEEGAAGVSELRIA